MKLYDLVRVVSEKDSVSRYKDYVGVIVEVIDDFYGETGYHLLFVNYFGWEGILLNKEEWKRYIFSEEDLEGV